jgi:gag-polypeptide of LTR copia-type
MAPSISFPPAAAIEILDGSNWPTWSSRILALLRMNGLRSHVTKDKPTMPPLDWSMMEDMLLGILEMYSQKDIWTTVLNDTKFATCKLKWEELKCVYEGIGSMSTFNTWVSLTRMALENSQPMLPQLQKLNDACMTLKNNDMLISNLQFCFILIKALPNSYSAIASTILATGAPSALSLQTIQEWILNEEGQQSSSSTSLNKVAPVK